MFLTSDFVFHVGNHAGIWQMLTWVRKTATQINRMVSTQEEHWHEKRPAVTK